MGDIKSDFLPHDLPPLISGWFLANCLSIEIVNPSISESLHKPLVKETGQFGMGCSLFLFLNVYNTGVK